jgi:hypothetical protein
MVPRWLWACLLLGTTCLSADLFSPTARGDAGALNAFWLPAGVIVDTDPTGLIRSGWDFSDDLAVLAVRGAQDRAELLAVTLTYGNSLLTHSKTDMQQLFELSGMHLEGIPTAAGVDWSSSRSEPNAAADLIVSTVLSAPANFVVVVCLGPLTNLAAAIQRAPAIVPRLRAVVISGGRLDSAMLSGALDLNLIRSDVEATQTVLNAAVPKILVPRETCAESPLTAPVLNIVLSNCPGSAMCEYLPVMQRRMEQGVVVQRSRWGQITGDADERSIRGSEDGKRGVLVCDLIAVSALLNPNSFHEWDLMSVEAGSFGLDSSILQAGMTADQVQSLLRPSMGSLPIERGRSVSFPNPLPSPPPTSEGLDLPDELSLRNPGTVLVPRSAVRMPDGTGSWALFRGVAFAMLVPHARLHESGRETFEDDGFFSPYVFWPIVMGLIGALGLGAGCCAALFRGVVGRWPWTESKATKTD